MTAAQNKKNREAAAKAEENKRKVDRGNWEGKVEGNVRARSVTVEGHLNGTIAALDVILASTAVITGEVVAEKIQIDLGANVKGRLSATAKETA